MQFLFWTNGNRSERKSAKGSAKGSAKESANAIGLNVNELPMNKIDVIKLKCRMHMEERVKIFNVISKHTVQSCS